jgi:hypothetical protein
LFGFAAKWKRLKPARLKRLADSIDALVEKDNRAIDIARVVEAKRASGAVELHHIFRRFVDSVNALATKASLVLDPEEFEEGMFLDSNQNFFQIHVRGRILLVTFGPPFENISTENFRIPYILEGTVRCFNQELLEHESIEEHSVFYCYCMNGIEAEWRYSKAHTYQTGPVDNAYLASVFESLL